MFGRIQVAAEPGQEAQIVQLNCDVMIIAGFLG